MRTSYESDISKAQFAKIQPLLESCRKQTKPRTVDLHEVFCALLYLLKSGCQWRMLPKEFPKWSTVYKYFKQWSTEPATEGSESVLAQVLKKIGWRHAYVMGIQRES